MEKLQYKNDPTDSYEDAPTELEDALQDAWKEKTAKWRAERRIDDKNLAIDYLIELYSTLDGKEYLVNSLKLIKEL